MGLAIVLLFVAHAIEKYPTRDGRIAFVTQLDNIIYDLGEMGHWPWSRSLMAGLIGKLLDRYGIEVLGFDVVWAERDTSSGIDTLDALAQKDFKQVSGFQEVYKSLRPALDNDELFAKAMQGRPVVLGYYFNGEERAVRVNALPEPVLPSFGRST
jgi:adenylate cyclase